MKLENLRIADLTPDPQNARQHDDKNLKAIMGSLKEFGQRKPIVITEAGVIVAGNGTVEAAKRLGWLDIEVVKVPSDWTDAQVKAFAIADNRTAELANWNQEVLTSQLLELEAEGWELAEFGFEAFELPDEDKPIIEDEIPESAPGRVALGDIWKLGNHRLMCGDSFSKDLIEKLMLDKKADLILTDPPYRQDSSGGKNDLIGKAVNKVTDSIAAMIDFEPQGFLDTLPTYFDKNMNTFIFCNKDLVPDYLNWAILKKYAFNILFWKKPNALPLADSHRPDVEYIIFIRKNAIWNNSLPNVSYSKLLEFGRENSTIHPTMKPVALLANQILISSSKNGIVVDPFLGSGSTLVACEQTNRTCYGFELDPKYCDVIIERWEKLTGQKAELLPAKAD
jgi:site-specific DNA-methyltransferase (adenine-specific)